MWVEGGEEPSPLEIAVPGDLSSAAFLVGAALLLDGSDLTISRVGLNPTRSGLLEVLRGMGAGLDAEAQNGPVNVVVPADYSARFVTGTINGPRSFDYAIEANRRSAWITTTLGRGGPPVRRASPAFVHPHATCDRYPAR